MSSAARPLPRDAGALEGVYRYRHTVDGRPAYYAVNGTGEIIGFWVARPGESEARLAAKLVRSVHGSDAESRHRNAARLVLLP